MNDNKTIAINTVILTIKLIITTLCSFVVSRLILRGLGADNYGLYNVVGGIVAMLNLVATSMIATSYRYIAVEIGKGDNGNPRRIYSTLLLIHLVLAFLLLFVGWPLGALYIEKYLTISNATINDAHFVYVFSLLATFFSIIVVPSNGLLVAKEKFLPISFIEIARALLNVAVAGVLLVYLGNRLRLYSVLMASLNILYSVSFHIYCKIKYAEIVRFELNLNKSDYKEITSFTGWMLLGASAVIGRTQGLAMVINLFFRNSVNAAFGIATQVGNATSMFTTTLRQSVTPQIMKNQEGNPGRSLNLVYVISRYTYLIMLVICVPLLLCMDTVLSLWLGENNVPQFTGVFAIFLIMSSMVSNLNSGFDASIQASGRIKKNQIGYTIINLSIIPIVYILFHFGFPSYISVIVGLFLSIITLFFQAYIMHEQTDFSYSDYLKKTIYPSILTTVVAFIPMLLLRESINDDLRLIIGFMLVSIMWTLIIVFFLGMSKGERLQVVEFMKNKLSKRNLNLNQ